MFSLAAITIIDQSYFNFSEQIVETEVMTQRREHRLAEEQLEKHQAHDNNVLRAVVHFFVVSYLPELCRSALV